MVGLLLLAIAAEASPGGRDRTVAGLAYAKCVPVDALQGRSFGSGNSTQLRIYSLHVCRLWRSVLIRRSQRAAGAISDGRPYRDSCPERALGPTNLHAPD